MGSRRMVLMNLFLEQQWKCRLLHRAGENKERVR